MTIKPIVAVALAISLLNAIDARFVVQAKTIIEPTALKQSSPPPNGNPDDRDRAGTRSTCGESQVALTPMLPKTNGEFSGYTLNGYPSFWFYIPYERQSIDSGRFSLKDERGREVMSVDVEMPETPGLVEVALPTTATPLEKNQSYRWDLIVYCNASNSNSQSVSQSGLVERIEDSNLQHQLDAAETEEKLSLYSERRIWYDSAIDLDRLRRSPRQWSQFVRAIGVESFSKSALEELAIPATPDKSVPKK